LTLFATCLVLANNYSDPAMHKKKDKNYT